jgi:hypothetical protein
MESSKYPLLWNDIRTQFPSVRDIIAKHNKKERKREKFYLPNPVNRAKPINAMDLQLEKIQSIVPFDLDTDDERKIKKLKKH